MFDKLKGKQGKGRMFIIVTLALSVVVPYLSSNIMSLNAQSDR